MTVNKTKSVEVELSAADVIQALKDFALRAHPSLKKADEVVAAMHVSDTEPSEVTAQVFCTFKAKEQASK